MSSQPSDDRSRLESTVAAAREAPPPAPEDAPPRRIGPYQLLHSIGEGGMGEVWLAEQLEPVRRRVALKIIKAGMDTKEVVARFESERQVLAMMDHPAIARVLDAGSTPEGRPYFVMEHVQGVAITEHCDAQRLSTAERLALMAEVCDGVQHAHQKAIIHRDLKPSNILVSVVDGKAQPKIIDFGIAKAIGRRLTDRTLLTELGAVIGTPEYMSPEQADSTGEDVDTRTDVYSLGVVLYELLTGELPFSSRELRAKTDEELRRTLREVEPPRPSTRLRRLEEATAREIARRRRTEPGTLRRQLQGDLDSITLKAMEKERGRRYGGAAELGEDLRRHLRHEPVLAQPPSTGYRLRKYLRRHRVAATVVSGLTVLLVAYAASMAVQTRRIAAERDRANRERETAERASAFLASMLGTVKPDALGKSLWSDLHHRVGAAHGDESGASPEALDALAALDRALKGVSPTQTALHLLDGEILDRAGKTIEHDMAGDPVLASRLEHTLGTTYVSLGLYPQGVHHFQRAIALRTAALGPENADTLDSMRLLADAYARQGRYSDAQSLYSRVLEVRRRVRGPEHPETLNALFGLATAYQRQGKNEEAEKILTPLLDVERRTFGPEHLTTLKTGNELATVYWNQGRYEDAEKLLRTSVEANRKNFGPEFPDTLVDTNNLAVLSATRGNLAQAETLFTEVLAVSQKVLGPEHPDTLGRMANLANLYLEEGRYPEAEKLVAQALEGKRRVLGPEHPSTLHSMNALAEVYVKEGRFGEAEALARTTLDARQRVLGPGHPRTLASVTTLAIAEVGQRHYREAEALAAEAIAGYERAKLGGSEDIGLSRATRGRALTGLGQLPEAERELLAAERLAPAKTPAHADVVPALVELYTRWEAREPGKGHAAEAARWRQKVGPPAP